MKKHSLVCLYAGLLGAALSGSALAQAEQSSPLPSPPVHTVTFNNGQTVQLEGPQATKNSDDFWDEWSFDTQFPSPDGKFMAVRFVQSSKNPRHDPMLVYLVGQKGSSAALKDSDLLEFAWSTDSKYLLGKGSSAVRLWNTNGTLRFKDFSQSGKLVITELKPNGQGICLALRPATYPADQPELNTTIAQVALPYLNVIRSTRRNTPAAQQTGFCP